MSRCGESLLSQCFRKKKTPLLLTLNHSFIPQRHFSLWLNHRLCCLLLLVRPTDADPLSHNTSSALHAALALCLFSFSGGSLRVHWIRHLMLCSFFAFCLLSLYCQYSSLNACFFVFFRYFFVLLHLLVSVFLWLCCLFILLCACFGSCNWPSSRTRWPACAWESSIHPWTGATEMWLRHL